MKAAAFLLIAIIGLKLRMAPLQEWYSKLKQLRTDTDSHLIRQNACSHTRSEPEEGMLILMLDVQEARLRILILMH